MVDRKTQPISDGWGRRNTAGVVIASNLRFNSISHSYGERHTLKDVSLEIKPGEVMCLLGPSGSGKSTLLKLAAGLIAPTSGEIFIDDRLVSDKNSQIAPEKRGIGLVFQDFALFPHLSIIKNVQFGLTALSRLERKRSALSMLTRVGLEGCADLYPHNLSGGEQQRVALARALAPRPGILLMDEPFSGLDARLRDSVRDETLGLLRDTRSTVLIVTHDPEEALQVSDRIALMRDGQIVQVGDASTLYKDPNSLFTANFFTSINILDGVCSAKKVDTILGEFACPATRYADGKKIAVCIRPTDIALREIVSNRKKPFPVGHVISRRFLGNVEMFLVNVDGLEKPIMVRQKAGQVADSAKAVGLEIARAKAIIFDK